MSDSETGTVTNDQIGTGSAATVGADIAPAGPVQDMWAYDGIAGTFPPSVRDAAPSVFTGGTGGGGLGGTAEPMSAGGVGPDGVVYERRGF